MGNLEDRLQIYELNKAPNKFDLFKNMIIFFQITYLLILTHFISNFIIKKDIPYNPAI